MHEEAAYQVIRQYDPQATASSKVKPTDCARLRVAFSVKPEICDRSPAIQASGLATQSTRK
jgi:hypothetical protein